MEISVYGTTEDNLDKFTEELFPYLKKYFRWLKELSPDRTSQSLPDKLKQIGRRYRTVRKELVLSRTEVVRTLGVDYMMYTAFEGGLVPIENLPRGFLERLDKLLGIPQLWSPVA